MSVILFLKNWTLPVSMIFGALSYFVYTSIPALAPTKPFVHAFVALLQPALIFAMLFLTFCKVKPQQLRLCRWHIPLLLIQAAGFLLPAALLRLFPQMTGGVWAESFMICMICPTATAAVVVAGKLGGNAATLTTYTVLINCLTALLVPTVVPLIHPQAGITFLTAFGSIMCKVFPLLFIPFVAAMLVRRFLPKVHSALVRPKDLAFYLWAVALAVAIAVTVKSIVHSDEPFVVQAGIAVSSLICCTLQFALGRWVGKHNGEPVSAGQALGQKNTVFAIWMGYTFMTPVTSVAGGFYSIWHNVYNSYQLYRKRRAEESTNSTK